MLRQVPLPDQRPEMLLQRVAIALREANGVGHGDAAMLAGEFDNLQRKLGQFGQHDLLALDLALQVADLLGQCAQAATVANRVFCCEC